MPFYVGDVVVGDKKVMDCGGSGGGGINANVRNDAVAVVDAVATRPVLQHLGDDAMLMGAVQGADLLTTIPYQP